MNIKLYDLSIPSYSKCYLFRDFPSMSRTCICFLLPLSLHLFYSSLLCDSSTHIVIDDDQMWSSLQHRLSQGVWMVPGSIKNSWVDPAMSCCVFFLLHQNHPKYVYITYHYLDLIIYGIQWLSSNIELIIVCLSNPCHPSRIAFFHGSPQWHLQQRGLKTSAHVGKRDFEDHSKSSRVKTCSMPWSFLWGTNQVNRQ